ncbi:MAG: tetratricopeptide repeat protein [Bacteroidota bacterium]
MKKKPLLLYTMPLYLSIAPLQAALRSCKRIYHSFSRANHAWSSSSRRKIVPFTYATRNIIDPFQSHHLYEFEAFKHKEKREQRDRHRSCTHLFPLASLSAALMTQSEDKEKKEGALPHSNLLNLSSTPSPFEYAVLSAHVYQNDAKVGDIVELQGKDKLYRLEDWKVAKNIVIKNDEKYSFFFELLKKMKPMKQEYRGRIYVNERKKQIVLAHQGTDPSNISHVKTDIDDIWLDRFTRKGLDNFAYGIMEELGAVREEIENKNNAKFSVSSTGHSLGGWLSHICTFLSFFEYEEKGETLPSLTFDAPGTLAIATRIYGDSVIAIEKTKQLNIINYVSSPNLVNTCQSQVATLYRVVFVNHFNESIAQHTLDSHRIDNFVEAFNPQTGDAIKCSEVLKWPGHQQYFHYRKKFLQQKNQNNPKPQDDREKFDIHEHARYRIKDFNPKKTYKRHMTQKAQKFIKKKDVSQAHRDRLAKTSYAKYLEIDENDLDEDYVRILKSGGDIDVRVAIDDLICLVQGIKDMDALNEPIERREETKYAYDFNDFKMKDGYFVGRTHEINELNKALDPSKDFAIAPPITGPPGIGKRMLVEHFLKQRMEKRSYDGIISIDASSHEKINQKFSLMATEMRLSAFPQLASDVLNPSTPQQDDTDGIDLKKIKKKLRMGHYLYLFENAPDMHTIRSYLDGLRGHIIITSCNSRRNDWDKNNLVLKPFTEEEIMELATQGYLKNGDDPDLKKLITIMPKHPLAVQQTFRLLMDSSTKSLLRKCEKNKSGNLSLLAEFFNKKDVDSTQRNLLEPFIQSIENLQESEIGRKGLSILQKIAYLNGTSIPIELIQNLEEDEDDILTGRYLAKLEQLSLIQKDHEKEVIHVHEIVQDLIRIQCPPKNKFIEKLAETFLAYNEKRFDSLRKSRKQIYTKDFGSVHWKTLLAHGEALLKHPEISSFTKKADIYAQLGKICEILLLYKKAVCYFAEAVRIREKELKEEGQRKKELKEEDLRAATAYEDLGRVRFKQGKYDEAEDFFEKVIKIREKQLGKEDPKIAIAYENKGNTCYRKGMYKDSKKYHKAALDIRKKRLKKCKPLGKDHLIKECKLDIADSHNYLGNAFCALNNPEKGKEQHKKAKRIREKELGKKHPVTAQSYNNLANIYRKEGEHQKAIDLFNKIKDIYEKDSEDKNHPDLIIVYNNLGKVHYVKEEDTKAKEKYQKALEICEKTLGEEHHFAIVIRKNIASLALEKRDYEKAEEEYLTILELCKDTLGEEHPEFESIKKKLAQIHEKKQEKESLLSIIKGLTVTCVLIGGIQYINSRNAEKS